MNQGLIPKRYAKALYEYAGEQGLDTQVRALMERLAAAFAAEPALAKAVANPFVSRTDKEQLLSTAAGADAGDPVMSRFLSLLAANNRLDMAREIALAYLKIYRQEHNIKLVTVTTASPLDQDSENRLKALIQQHLGGATMEYDRRVDPALVGGFTVAIDNERLDASVANELKQLRLKLLSK